MTAAHDNHSETVPFDERVWREWGTPLVPATGEGALDGETVAVKDLYSVAGFPLGAGVPDYLGPPRPAHADVVARLLAAGAEITGIAHTDEFAYSITGGNGRYGMPVNPAAPQRIPGGSSSGSAVAVASGAVTIGLGTDTAGSIRVPAAYQGLWGIRTTHGCLPTTGVVPLAPSFDTVGWLTRDPATLRRVAECLLPATGSAAAELIVDPNLCAVADDELAAATRATAGRWGAEQADLSLDLDACFTAFRTVQAFEAWSNHGDWITAHPGALEPEVAQRLLFASTVTRDHAEESRGVLAQAATALRTVLAGRILVLPSTATPPPPRTALLGTLESGRTRTLHLTCLAAIAGAPAISMPRPPMHGLPHGLCVIGAPGTDHALIEAAIALGAAT
ncbi:amidase family protein [Nocardia sp. NPDC004722]